MVTTRLSGSGRGRRDRVRESRCTRSGGRTWQAGHHRSERRLGAPFGLGRHGRRDGVRTGGFAPGQDGTARQARQKGLFPLGATWQA